MSIAASLIPVVHGNPRLVALRSGLALAILLLFPADALAQPVSRCAQIRWAIATGQEEWWLSVCRATLERNGLAPAEARERCLRSLAGCWQPDGPKTRPHSTVM